jgi:hypothetical protein
MDHLTCPVSWTLLQDHVGRLEATLLDAAYSLMRHPRAAGSPKDDQLTLPLRHGGVWVPAHDPPGGSSRPTVSGSPGAGG